VLLLKTFSLVVNLEYTYSDYDVRYIFSFINFETGKMFDFHKCTKLQLTNIYAWKILVHTHTYNNYPNRFNNIYCENAPYNVFLLLRQHTVMNYIYIFIVCQTEMTYQPMFSTLYIQNESIFH